MDDNPVQQQQQNPDDKDTEDEVVDGPVVDDLPVPVPLEARQGEKIEVEDIENDDKGEVVDEPEQEQN